MKFLHTSDWHVGKGLRGRSRHDEHREVLAEIVDIARREQVDAVLIAGDLYDSSVPSPTLSNWSSAPCWTCATSAPRSSPSPETTTTHAVSTPTSR